MKKYALITITFVMISVFWVTPASALSVSEVRARLSAIISELVAVLAQLNTGIYCDGYDGGTDIASIQSALNMAGYDAGNVDGKFGDKTTAAVTAFQTAEGLKVDGKVGPQTRAALQARVPYCPDLDLKIGNDLVFAPKVAETPVVQTESTTTNTSASTTEESSSESTESTTTETSSVSEQQTTLEEGTITASVRSSNTKADDTAVFTYEINPTVNGFVYIPNNTTAFNSRIVKASGGQVSSSNTVYSLISSADVVTGLDGKLYFKLGPSDTISLRATIQPGPGSYYGQLVSLSYTTDDVTQTGNPTYTNQGFDSLKWTSETIKVLN